MTDPLLTPEALAAQNLRGWVETIIDVFVAPLGVQASDEAIDTLTQAIECRAKEIAERDLAVLRGEREEALKLAEHDSLKWLALDFQKRGDLLGKANERTAALKAERDAALRQIETLREALMGVKSTARGYLCWCDNSHNAVEYGHQPKCIAASRALAAAAPTTPREQEAK